MRRPALLLIAAAVGGTLVPVDRVAPPLLAGAPGPLYAHALGAERGSGRGGTNGRGERQGGAATASDRGQAGGTRGGEAAGRGGEGAQGGEVAGRGGEGGTRGGEAVSHGGEGDAQDGGAGAQAGEGGALGGEGGEGGGHTGNQESDAASGGAGAPDATGRSLAPPHEGRDGGPDELLALGLDPADLAHARRQGFTILEQRTLPFLGLVVTRLGLPRGLPLPAAQARLRTAVPGRSFAPNDGYEPQAHDPAPEGDACPADGCWGKRAIGWRSTPACGAGSVVGLIDTRIDAATPALAGRVVATRSFLAAGARPAVSDHGTSLAALLLGGGPAATDTGLLPAARLAAADVFADAGGHARAGALEVAEALDWTAGLRPTVINTSFAGPDNPVLAAAIAGVLARGIPVVAAAGNDGPEAPPAYPAAYPGVIAATAVDRGMRPYRRANRGDYVAFAAPGVDVAAGGAPRSGTSYAAAFVTAVVAEAATRGVPEGPGALARHLAAAAVDLGPPGKDPVFGWGLVRAPEACAAPGRDVPAPGAGLRPSTTRASPP